jgi:copper chaperone CopZ
MYMANALNGARGGLPQVIDYMHELPGRVRIRCPILRKNVAKTTAIRNSLESTCGVKSVTVNPSTGSFTIYYDHGRTSPAELLTVLEKHGLRKDAVPTVEPVDTRVRIPLAIVRGRALSSPTPAIAKAVAGFVIEKAIERSLLALAAAVL